MSPVDAIACLYHPFYCEENVWHLCDNAGLSSGMHAVVVTSEAQVCPLWHQRCAADVEHPVFWDYHVFAVARGKDSFPCVYDLDSTLAFPTSLATYIQATFGASGAFPSRYAPRFRIIPGSHFRAHFFSNRNHMRDADGRYLQAPPPWPPILGEKPRLTLAEARNMALSRPPTVVVDVAGLRSYFSSAWPCPEGGR